MYGNECGNTWKTKRTGTDPGEGCGVFRSICASREQMGKGDHLPWRFVIACVGPSAENGLEYAALLQGGIDRTGDRRILYGSGGNGPGGWNERGNQAGAGKGTGISRMRSADSQGCDGVRRRVVYQRLVLRGAGGVCGGDYLSVWARGGVRWWEGRHRRPVYAGIEIYGSHGIWKVTEDAGFASGKKPYG